MLFQVEHNWPHDVNKTMALHNSLQKTVMALQWSHIHIWLQDEKQKEYPLIRIALTKVIRFVHAKPRWILITISYKISTHCPPIPQLLALRNLACHFLKPYQAPSTPCNEVAGRPMEISIGLIPSLFIHYNLTIPISTLPIAIHTHVLINFDNACRRFN